MENLRQQRKNQPSTTTFLGAFFQTLGVASFVTILLLVVAVGTGVVKKSPVGVGLVSAKESQQINKTGVIDYATAQKNAAYISTGSGNGSAKVSINSDFGELENMKSQLQQIQEQQRIANGNQALQTYGQ